MTCNNQCKGLIYDGFPSLAELKACGGWPTEARFAQGPVAVIECVQEIPCNPCENACPRGAIAIGDPITNLPRLDEAKCTGCGLCVAKCPGLAIFVVDKTFSETEATITFPFEYYPLPEKDNVVQALNRAGEYVCQGRVVKVLSPPSYDHTTVVTIAVPKAYGDEVRTIKRLNVADAPTPAAAEAQCGETMPDEILICRCEEITAGEIRRAIQEYGATTVNGVKRRCRAGMGLCQGRTCGKLVTRIIQEMTGAPASSIEPATARPPVRPVTFGEMAGGKNND